MLNIGIIGPGRVAERHANALQKISNAQLYSICGRSLDDVKIFANKYKPNAQVYNSTDLDQMLSDPNLHAVIIATPDNFHAEQIILSCKAKKAVLVEKPVCTSIESSENILRAIDKHPITLAVGYHLRWHPGLRCVAMKSRNNELGEISCIQFRWGVNFIEHAKWRLNSTLGKWCCLSVLGTHLIDLARWMLLPICGEVVNTKSQIEYLDGTTIDKAVLISMQFESGARAEIFCSLVVDEPLSLKLHTNKLDVYGDHLAGPIEQRKLMIGNEPFQFLETDSYFLQLNAFISSIIDKTPAEVSLEEGLKNVAHLISIKS